MNSKTIKARVARGAELLDREVPGWADKISLDELAMCSCAHCILGQLFGRFLDGANKLNVDECEYGFEIGCDINAPGRYSYYNRLNEHWRQEIHQRREKQNA